MERPDYLHRNIEQWTAYAPQYAEGADAMWSSEPRWGIWGIPETDVGLLGEVDGRDVLEVGCGTAYVSSWIARRGGRPVGLDPTPAQIATAQAMQQRHELHFPLVRAIGEALPFADAVFDLVISEYGAAIWSDPYAWIPEAARVLRPGGELAFLGNASLLMLCANDDEDVPAAPELLRPLRGLHRLEWPGTDAVEFHLSHGDWVRLLRREGLEILDLIELYPPDDASTSYGFVDAGWATRWPSEEVWRARKR